MTKNPSIGRLNRRSVLKTGALALSGAAFAPSLANAAVSGTYSAPYIRRQDAVTLKATVWVGDAEFKAMNELAAVFNETHPEITIEFINIIDGGPWGRDQLQRMIAGGEAPDIMMLNTGQFEAFGSRGALANLEEFISADQFDMDAYFPAAVDGCRIDGDVHGLPKDISDHLVYINKEFFADAGVDLPSPDWTWEDYRETAQALTGENTWGIGIVNAAFSWGSFVHSNGGEILNDDRTECRITSDEAIEALKVYYGILTEDEAAVPPGALPQTPGEGDQFLSSITGMHMAGPWFRPGLVEEELFDWTVVPYPRPGGDPPISVLYTDQWSMSSSSKHPEQAWELLKFLGGPEGHHAWAEIYGSRSINPVQEIAFSDDWLTYGGEEHRDDNQAFLDQLEHTVPPPTNFGDGAQAENVWNEQLDLVIVEQQSVEDAVQAICDSLSSVLGGGLSAP